MLRQLYQYTAEPERYHVSFYWSRRRYRHIITFERLPDNTVIIYDPQTGEIHTRATWEELIKKVSPNQGMSVCRVDNMFLNTDINGVTY